MELNDTTRLVHVHKSTKKGFQRKYLRIEIKPNTIQREIEMLGLKP